jgi:hypothetical protein
MKKIKYILLNKKIKYYNIKIKQIQKNNTNIKKEYKFQNNETNMKEIKTKKVYKIQEMKENLILYFLPQHYKTSVTENYQVYVKWQFLQYIFSSICGVLSIQSLLYAMGLGTSTLPLGVALNWIIKDGIGQLGGIILGKQKTKNKVSVNSQTKKRK